MKKRSSSLRSFQFLLLIMLLSAGLLSAGIFQQKMAKPFPGSITSVSSLALCGSTTLFDLSAYGTILPAEELQSGDLIFQTSRSSQSKAVQLATKSTYSHCGIIYKEGAKFYVFEAIQPVKRTPLKQWIARGEGGKYVVKRLKNAAEVLTPAVLQKMKQVGDGFRGKNYDLTFEWSDDRIYCSELIWKVYQRATGLEIGKLSTLSSFDLSNEVVKKKMKERYGDQIPMNETVISPAAVFDSELLITVKSN